MPEQAVLFPMDDRDMADQALKRLRSILDKERKMRDFVFRKDEKKRSTKVKEMDEAMRHVGVLEGLLCKHKII